MDSCGSCARTYMVKARRIGGPAREYIPASLRGDLRRLGGRIGTPPKQAFTRRNIDGFRNEYRKPASLAFSTRASVAAIVGVHGLSICAPQYIRRNAA